MGVLKSLLNKIGDAIFVDFSCMFCGVETVNESHICPECEKKLIAINGDTCKKCGAPVSYTEDSCFICFENKYKFKSHKSCFVYDELSSTPVKLLKYERRRYLAESMAKVMYAFHKEIFKDVDLITFVPMTYKRYKNRGYNQSYELAKHLSEISKIKLEKLLIKNNDTQHQADLRFEERTKNLKGSFEIVEDYNKIIEGKKILLIDDVFTTGSTLHECSRVLLKANAESVIALTFLKTDPYKNISNLPF